MPQLYEQIRANRTTLIFTNTRFLAEYIFQNLWDVNDDNLPIGVHHGSLEPRGAPQGRGCDGPGRVRALVATASLDLGVDWGDIDLVVQMGAPKGSSRLLQRIGRANHRLDQPSRALLVPGNRFEFLEATAAGGGRRRPARRRNLPSGRAGCSGATRHGLRLRRAVRRSRPAGRNPLQPRPMPGSTSRSGSACSPSSKRVAMRCKAYDKFKRIVRDKGRRLAADRIRSRHSDTA